jgi:hypothetical protein
MLRYQYSEYKTMTGWMTVILNLREYGWKVCLPSCRDIVLDAFWRHQGNTNKS